LLSTISSIYKESTDRIVLQNCCQTLVFCAKRCHARSDIATLTMHDLWDATLTRLMNLLKKKKSINDAKSSSGGLKNSSDDDESDEDDSSMNTLENVASSIRLCLLRLSILIKRWPFIGRRRDDVESGDNQLDGISVAVTSYLTNELQSRQTTFSSENEDDEDILESPKIWSSVDDDIHLVVSKSVSDGFDLLLGIVAWRLLTEIQRIDDGTENDDMDKNDIESHIVLRMRHRIEDLIKKCYEQFLPTEVLDKISKPHQMFSMMVQEHALRVSGDIRILFPRKWSLAKSQLLKAFAIDDDAMLAGGGYRFLRSQEWRLKDQPEDTVIAKQQKQDALYKLLLPMARALCTNWDGGSRKEAGAVLLHIAGSGKDASDLVHCMLRVLKKINPVRLLEAQMACLRQKFEEWAEDEPEEPGDRPNDDEMREFEEKEHIHLEKFDALVTLASKFSSALGVGKIRDKVLNAALLGFVREGVRFAFSTQMNGSDEPLPLGCRLVFLGIVTKYMTWIRHNKEFKLALRNALNSCETSLRNHPEYNTVFEEDLKSVIVFRKAGDLGDYMDEGDTGTPRKSRVATSTVRPPITQPRTSLGSSVSSIRSKVSGSLDSINEEDPSIEDNDNNPSVDNDDHTDDHDGASHSTPSPRKRPRTVYSARTQSSAASTLGPDFGDDTEDSDTGGSSSM
jgi:cohesin complex subunit SA-1/2